MISKQPAVLVPPEEADSAKTKRIIIEREDNGPDILGTCGSRVIALIRE